MRSLRSEQRRKTNSKSYRLRSKYGLGEEGMNRILQFQGGKCPICKTDSPTTSKGTAACWVVDHCHQHEKETKEIKIRGVLCSRCNSLLGMAQDNRAILMSAIEYLKTCDTRDSAFMYKVLSVHLT